MSGTIECSIPDSLLYVFEGKLTHPESLVPSSLTFDNFLLRGSSLRNT